MKLPMKLTHSYRLGALVGSVKAFLAHPQAQGLPAEVQGILLNALLREEAANAEVLASINARSTRLFGE